MKLFLILLLLLVLICTILLSYRTKKLKKQINKIIDNNSVKIKSDINIIKDINELINKLILKELNDCKSTSRRKENKL